MNFSRQTVCQIPSDLEPHEKPARMGKAAVFLCVQRWILKFHEREESSATVLIRRNLEFESLESRRPTSCND